MMITTLSLIYHLIGQVLNFYRCRPNLEAFDHYKASATFDDPFCHLKGRPAIRYAFESMVSNTSLENGDFHHARM